MRGGIFIKHGRSGNPHPRFVWLTKDKRYVCWRKIGSAAAATAVTAATAAATAGETTIRHKRMVPIDTLVRVEKGSASTNFHRWHRKKHGPHIDTASFSLIFSSRTLALELDVLHCTQDTANVIRMRNQWVSLFNNMINTTEQKKRERGEEWREGAEGERREEDGQ